MAPTPWNPETTAIVCVECQNGVLGPDSVLPALAADSSELVSSVGRLLDSARQFGARVVHSTYEGNLGGQPTGTARLWRVLGPATADWAPGSASTTVLSELLAPTDLVIPRHHGLFPTLDSELLPVLRGWDVRTVVLAGVSLNLAITHTAGHLTQAGFELVVPRDAVGGTPQEYAKQVLDNSIAVLGRLTTVDQLIGEWTPVRSDR
jgi:nicotinamidase-related amidase